MIIRHFMFTLGCFILLIGGHLNSLHAKHHCGAESIFGSIYVDQPSSFSFLNSSGGRASPGLWIPFTGFNSSGVSSRDIMTDPTSGTITVAKSGLYKIAFSVSFSANVTFSDHSVFYFIANTDEGRQIPISAKVTISFSGREYNLSGEGFASLEAGDVVSLQVQTPSYTQTASPLTLTVTNGNLNVTLESRS